MFDEIHGTVIKALVKPAVGVDSNRLVGVLADVDTALDGFKILKEVLYAH